VLVNAHPRWAPIGSSKNLAHLSSLRLCESLVKRFSVQYDLLLWTHLEDAKGNL
jgi:hypothetical protein